jgi:acetyl esterase/lipase
MLLPEIHSPKVFRRYAAILYGEAMSMVRTLAVLILFAGNALAQAKPQTAEEKQAAERERQFQEMISRGVVYRVKGMDKVELRNDVTYKRVENGRLLADIYLPRPRSREAKVPAVVFIHGGVGGEVPVKPKDWGPYRSWGELVAASGLAAVTFNHRLGFPNPQLTKAESDLEELLSFLRENAEYFHIEKDKICLVAFSAGGPLLSMAMRDRPPSIRCLVSYYNFLDIQQTEHHKQFESAETLKRFSPITYLGPEAKRIPPMLIARAGRDEIPMLNDSIDRFVQAAIAKNAPVTFLNHPSGPHGFDTRTPDARSREILKTTIDFLKWHLR